MKFYSLITFFLLTYLNSFSQAGEWTWVKGTGIGNSTGVFGTKGIASPSNVPPGIYEGCEWTDLNGNFWLFSGMSVSGAYNALWKYDPLTNEWTWMSGSNTLNSMGNYGVQGIPSVNNEPPGLTYAVSTWTDQSNNLWLYGGSDDDLWKYNIGTNEWTWMKGGGQATFSSPVYGVMGVADTANTPGMRSECSTTWTINNDLWLFGGYDPYDNALFNDMWKFNIATNSWTWMKGSNLPNSTGHFGTLGVEAAANEPCGRMSYSRWKDNAGNLWFFGGALFDTIFFNVQSLNDMWRYNPATNNWTWMGGNNPLIPLINSNGTQCVTAASNWPVSRFESRTSWTDSNGDFWMFGGGSTTSDGLNDLWKYCVAQNKWTWIEGDAATNISAVYGTIGVSAPSNKPSNMFGGCAWSGTNNYLYLYGGAEGSFNLRFHDLWRYKIDSLCVACASVLAPQAAFVYSDSGFCEGVCVNFTNQSINATAYQWSFPGANPSTSTNANPQNICYYTQGNYDVLLIATNGAGTDSFTISNAITVYPPVQFSPIAQHGDTLFSVPGYVNYQWYFDTTAIAGANSYYFIASQNGDYSVQVLDSNGCTAAATIIDVILSVENEMPFEYLNVYYSDNNFELKYQLKNQTAAILNITDEIGQALYSGKVLFMSGNNRLDIKSTELSSGIYFITISTESKTICKKIFIR
jgi:PKD repeat protein